MGKCTQWRCGLLAALLGATLPTARLLAQDDHPAATAPNEDRYLRVVEQRGHFIALEVAARTFAHPSGVGPRVSLVSVAHIGERELYAAVQKFLDGHDVVLYESVMPPGAGPVTGETPEARRAATKAALEFTASAIVWDHDKREEYPSSIADMQKFIGSADGRFEDWIATATTDAWDNAVAYVVKPDGAGFSLTSFGADGKPGGDDENADLSIDHNAAEALPPLFEEGDNIQLELANALGLEFQLDAVEYNGDDWRCSDMTVVQLDQAMRAKGVDFGPVSGALTGSSLPAKIATVVLRIIGFLDGLLENTLSDAFKVIMIDLLSDEVAMKQGLKQFGAGFEEVIVDQRNQVVIDDLKAVIADEVDVQSVAIFYGAAHMPDMAERLADQLGYEPVSQEWMTAIKINYAETSLSSLEIRMIRNMFRQQLRKQLRAAD